MEENNKPIEQAETHPEENRGNQKTFTQDDVNRIVQERLSKERSKLETVSNTTLEEREAALSERENKLSCKEYIQEKGYDVRLLDILDTNDADKFKKTTEELNAIYSGKQVKKVPCFSAPTPGVPLGNDLIAEAFKPKG